MMGGASEADFTERIFCGNFSSRTEKSSARNFMASLRVRSLCGCAVTTMVCSTPSAALAASIDVEMNTTAASTAASLFLLHILSTSFLRLVCHMIVSSLASYFILTESRRGGCACLQESL